MKSPNYLIIIFMLLSLGNLSAQEVSRGKVVEGLDMKSELLNKNIPFSIYLPPGYDNSDRSYPVVYLLHGYTDNETAWVQFGEVNETADRAIADREIPPMIIVMPDAEVTWYINDAKRSYPYEDMIFDEFIPYIEENFRIRKDKEFRAVAGLSMGGYGSLVWALHHPEIFSSCAAFSAAVYTDEELQNMSADIYDKHFGLLYGYDADSGRITQSWKENSVLNMMRTFPVEQIQKVRFYIDCGDDDFLYAGNSTLHILMRDRNIEHEYRVRNGAHNWNYWRTYILEGLKFMGASFNRGA